MHRETQIGDLGDRTGQRYATGPDLSPLSQAAPRADLWLRDALHGGSLSVLESGVSEYVVRMADADAALLAGKQTGVGFSYFRDRAALARQGLLPINVVPRTVDREGHVIGLGFPAPTATWAHEPHSPMPVDVFGIPGVPRPVTAHVTRLGPYEGRFDLVGDPAKWIVGALLTLRQRGVAHYDALRVQVTTRDAAGSYWFRMADRPSVGRAAIMLLRESAAPMTLPNLTTYGVSRRQASRGMSVRVLDGQDLRDALLVRLLGNQSFGRLPGVEDALLLRDELDDYAINIVCYLGERPVGTGRVVLNEGERQRSEIETEVGLPEWLWERGFAEVSRVAIHPSFRGGAAMVELFREIARIALTARCRYLVLDCIEKLVPTYRRVGAKTIGLKKRHPYSQETVHVMVIDLLESLTDLRGNLPYWLAVFGPVVKEFQAIGALEPYVAQMTPWQRPAYRVKLALSEIGTRALTWVG